MFTFAVQLIVTCILVLEAAASHTDVSASCDEHDETTAAVDTSTTETSASSKPVDCSSSYNFKVFNDLNGLQVSSSNYLLEKRPYGFYRLGFISLSVESCMDTCALHASCVSFTAVSTTGKSETANEEVEVFNCYGSDEPFDIFTNLSRTDGHHSGVCSAGMLKLRP